MRLCLYGLLSSLDRIYNQIAKADPVIADMTGRNPNVFYEVGYAHALDKPTVLLTQKADDIPFDLKHFPDIVYESKLVRLKEKLGKRVSWHVAHPTTTHESSRSLLDVYLSGELVTDAGGQFSYDDVPHFRVTLYNASARTFEAETSRACVISGEFLRVRDWTKVNPILQIKLPDGRFITTLPELPTLLPGEHRELGVYFMDDPQVREKELVILRILTAWGSRDYPLSLIHIPVRE